MRACVFGGESGPSGAPGRRVLEVLAHQTDQTLVSQVPGRRDDQVGRYVHRRVVFQHRVPMEALHRFPRAQNRFAQRMVLPEIRGKDLVHQVVRAVRLHLDLFQNDALLFFDIFLAERRVQHQVGQHVERLRKVLVQDLGVKTHQFLGREGIQVAADRIHRPCNVFGRARTGPFEQHVLDKMRDPVALPGFPARARSDPHSHRNRAHVRHRLGDDAHSVGQHGSFNVTQRSMGGTHDFGGTNVGLPDSFVTLFTKALGDGAARPPSVTLKSRCPYRWWAWTLPISARPSVPINRHTAPGNSTRLSIAAKPPSWSKFRPCRPKCATN